MWLHCICVRMDCMQTWISIKKGEERKTYMWGPEFVACGWIWTCGKSWWMWMSIKERKKIACRWRVWACGWVCVDMLACSCGGWLQRKTKEKQNNSPCRWWVKVCGWACADVLACRCGGTWRWMTVKKEKKLAWQVVSMNTWVSMWTRWHAGADDSKKSNGKERK